MGNFDRTRWFNSIFKMEVTTWLSVLLALITLGTQASASEPRVVCYYTNWSVYRPGTARFNPQNINPYLCTHLVYAFGGFTKDNTLKPFDKYQDIEKGGYAKFTGLKTYNKNLKTLLAIGGWNEGSTRFSPMVASRERRKEFVRNAIKFLRQNRFDGLDLDWEYPAFRDGGKPKDRENYAKLVKELREEFEREAEKTGKPRLLLTMAVPAGIEYIEKGFDVKTLNQYLDWMNLLSYDYHSAFEPAVNHHAPLYPLEEPNEYSVDNELNIDYTIKFYLENGADPDKIVLGIPTYGRSYTLFNPEAYDIGSPADGPGEQGDATREKGYLAYYEICEALKPKAKKRETSDEDSDEEDPEDQQWTVMYPNKNAMGPVAYKGNQWVGYDDIEIVKKKAEYVADNGLGGIMFWSIDNDDFRGACHDKPYPLIEAAKEAYFQKIGSTDNAIVRASEKPATRPSNRRNKPRTTTTTTTSRTTTAKSNKRTQVTSTTPAWNIITPEPPTTPDPGSDFKCVDEGFFPHPRDCKKYFWCLDSGPSNLGIVAHQFTCPSGLFFNKAADSCDFARNVLCKKPSATTKAPTKAPTTKAPTTEAPSTEAPTTRAILTTTRRPIKLNTKNSVYFRTTTTSTSTTTTTSKPEIEDEPAEDSADPTDEDAEDPRVIKELIDLIKKVGGIEQLEKQLHLGETSASTDGVITTTPSSFNKKLYQKVLERTKAKNRYSSNSIVENTAQNSRRGPQNAGLEASSDRDKLLRKDRPQYTTINRQRAPTSTTESSDDEEVEEEVEEVVQQNARGRVVDSAPSVATTARPLQYVNIRRARPTTLSTSDTADDSASRNALFERSEPFVSVSDTPSSLDILNARRDNIPEYVTIRRQRPTTEENTTPTPLNQEEEEELEETALERELSAQPQYSSISRTRSTASPKEPSTETPFKLEPTPETPSSPEPTTVLAVQISSLLNSPTSSEVENPETDAPATEESTTTTTSRPTTTTTARATLPTRRAVIRRRGSTSTTVAPSTTQVSQRNYTFASRRRILRPNEISSDSDSLDLSRKIRSTTPDSREIEGEPKITRRFRSRYQTQVDTDRSDSVAAAASPVSRGQFRPQEFNSDEVISLTPIDVDPEIVPKQSFNQRTERRFRRPATSATEVPVNNVIDSEVSAATVETRRPNLLPRGRSRFTFGSTTEVVGQVSTTAAPRRPTFARFTPRPFGRSSTSTASDTNLENTEITVEAVDTVTQRVASRPTFGRSRPTASPLTARKLPYPSRQSTTQRTLTNDDDDADDMENKGDDILLSESARAEQEHDEPEEEDTPRRRVVIKKLRASSSDDTVSTETIPIDDVGKKRIKVIKRRPATTTEAVESVISTETPTGPGLQRIRKVIRKKVKPVENQSEIVGKPVSSVDAQSSSTESFNYGEKTKPQVTTTAESIVEPTVEEVTELNKDEKKVNVLEEIIKTEIEEDLSEKVIKEVENSKLEVTETTSGAVVSDASISKTNEIKTETEDQVAKVVTEQTKGIINSNEVTTKLLNEAKIEIEAKPEVVVETEEKFVDITTNEKSVFSESPITESPELPESPETETTTVSTTLSTTTVRSRLPYRPRKKLFTSTTESSVPSSSRSFSRKYNPGVYTSPSTVDRPTFRPLASTRRPFSSKLFTRRPFTQKTTQKEEEEEEEEYNDEELLEEEPEPENPFVFVPPSQLFTRKPDFVEEEDEENPLEEIDDDVGREEEEEEEEEKLSSTTRRPGFRPKVVNSNTFRTSTTTTELPRKLSSSQNRTSIITRFSGNKPASDSKKRVQNVPPGYNHPVDARLKSNATVSKNVTEKVSVNIITTTKANLDKETTTEDDDYLTITSTTTNDNESTVSSDMPSTNTMEFDTATAQMEIDENTDDYLENTEGTTNYPTTSDVRTTTQIEPVYKSTIVSNVNSEIVTNPSTTTTSTPTSTTTTTTTTTTLSPIVKKQFNKLFSVSRVVEVNSKLDKHRLNKNNETTLIEEGKIMIEKKPVVDKIGEVSRYSLIKIVEDEIPIYLTKFGHVYPVDNPPENIIRIDEARNAKALVENFADMPRENLVASESVNEGYRIVKQDSNNESKVEHVPNDDFLSFVNDDKKTDQEERNRDHANWQFVPAAYDKEKVNVGKTSDIVTPRSSTTHSSTTLPSTLPLEGMFKSNNPIMARNIGDKNNQPFVVYSASVPNQQEEANIVNLSVFKPEAGRSIVTFAKGQEFPGALVQTEAVTAKDAVKVSVIPQTTEGTTETSSTLAPISSTTTSTIKPTSSPIIIMLSSTISSTEMPIISSSVSVVTASVTEEPTTAKISSVDAKRTKFAFPRRPIIKPTNITRPSNPPRTINKVNSTVNLSNQKVNKTIALPKSRLPSTRVQNVPTDSKKKPIASKAVSKTFSAKAVTTESPKITTERKPYFKSITRPSFRPAFFPRKSTIAPTTLAEDT